MIVIKRNKKWVARFVRFKIFIDGHFYKKIKAGEEIEIDLPKGLHQIQVQHGKNKYFMTSNVIRFREDGSTKTFLCWMDMKQKHRITYSEIKSALWLQEIND